MDLYHCMIELRAEAHALAFARATSDWMGHLQARGLVSDWRLMRRKFGLASGPHSDFLLEISLPNLAGLDTAFAALSKADDEALPPLPRCQSP